MTAIANTATQSSDHKDKVEGLMDKDVSEKERITLRLPTALYGRLDELRTITHASNVNEVLKNALLFYDALVRERLNGNDVYVISEDGEKTKYSVFL